MNNFDLIWLTLLSNQHFYAFSLPLFMFFICFAQLYNPYCYVFLFQLVKKKKNNFVCNYRMSVISAVMMRFGLTAAGILDLQVSWLLQGNAISSAYSKKKYCQHGDCKGSSRTLRCYKPLISCLGCTPRVIVLGRRMLSKIF